MIHTLTGESITFTTNDPKATVADVKQYILTHWSVPIPAQILICNGRVLSPESKTIVSADFYNDSVDIMVILSAKHLKPRSGAPGSITIANRMEMLLSRRELKRSVERRFYRQRSSQIAPATEIDTESAEQRRVPSTTSQNLFSTLAIAITPDPILIRQLQDMGFPEDQCRRVLLQHYNNIEMALNWLLANSGSSSHAEDDDVSDS